MAATAALPRRPRAAQPPADERQRLGGDGRRADVPHDLRPRPFAHGEHARLPTVRRHGARGRTAPARGVRVLQLPGGREPPRGGGVQGSPRRPDPRRRQDREQPQLRDDRGDRRAAAHLGGPQPPHLLRERGQQGLPSAARPQLAHARRHLLDRPDARSHPSPRGALRGRVLARPGRHTPVRGPVLRAPQPLRLAGRLVPRARPPLQAHAEHARALAAVARRGAHRGGRSGRRPSGPSACTSAVRCRTSSSTARSASSRSSSSGSTSTG